MKLMGPSTEQKEINSLISSKEKNKEHNVDTEIQQIIKEKGEKNNNEVTNLDKKITNNKNEEETKIK